MMFSSILLTFVTLSAGLRRAAIHTQNLDEVATVDMQREVPRRILANLEAEMSAVAENVVHTERVVHKDSFDSAFEEITQRGIRQADMSTLVETVAHKADVALMSSTSKLVVKKALMAHKTNSVQKSNASTLVAKVENVARKADVAHKANISGTSVNELHRAQKDGAAHRANSFGFIVKKELAAHTEDVVHKETASKLVGKEELMAHTAEATHKADASELITKEDHKAEDSHKANTSLTAVKEQHGAQKDGAAHRANSSAFIVKKELVAHTDGAHKETASKLVVKGELMAHKAEDSHKANISWIAEFLAQTEDVARKESASKLAEKEELVAHKAGVTHKADALGLVIKEDLKAEVWHKAHATQLVVKAEHMTLKADTAHKTNDSEFLFREQHVANKDDVAHKANASEIFTRQKHVAQTSDAAHKANVSIVNIKDAHVDHKAVLSNEANAFKVVVAAKQKDIVHKAYASALAVKKEHGAHKLPISHQATNTSDFRSEKPLMAHQADFEPQGARRLTLMKTDKTQQMSTEKRAELQHSVIHMAAAVERTAFNPAALSNEPPSLQPSTPPSTAARSSQPRDSIVEPPSFQPSTTTEEAELPPSMSAALHLVSHAQAQGASPGEETLARFKANAPAPAVRVPGDARGGTAMDTSDELSWDDSVDASVAIPSQGFEGNPVLHEDQHSMTADWQREHSNADVTNAQRLCELCRSRKSNPWCQRKCPDFQEAWSRHQPGDWGTGPYFGIDGHAGWRPGSMPPDASRPRPEGGSGEDSLSELEGLFKGAAAPKSVALCILLVVLSLAGAA